LDSAFLQLATKGTLNDRIFKKKPGRYLKPIILATQKAEVRRISVQGQPQA
jgi:hypothetical protein